jgi:hypothetical protein
MLASSKRRPSLANTLPQRFNSIILPIAVMAEIFTAIDTALLRINYPLHATEFFFSSFAFFVAGVFLLIFVWGDRTREDSRETIGAFVNRSFNAICHSCLFLFLALALFRRSIGLPSFAWLLIPVFLVMISTLIALREKDG